MLIISYQTFFVKINSLSTCRLSEGVELNTILLGLSRILRFIPFSRYITTKTTHKSSLFVHFAPLTTTMPQSLLTLCLILAVTLEMRGPITSVGPLANLLTTELSLTANQYGLVASLPIIAFGLFSFIAPAAVRRDAWTDYVGRTFSELIND